MASPHLWSTSTSPANALVNHRHRAPDLSAALGPSSIQASQSFRSHSPSGASLSSQSISSASPASSSYSSLFQGGLSNMGANGDGKTYNEFGASPPAGQKATSKSKFSFRSLGLRPKVPLAVPPSSPLPHPPSPTAPRPPSPSLYAASSVRSRSPSPSPHKAPISPLPPPPNGYPSPPYLRAPSPMGGVSGLRGNVTESSESRSPSHLGVERTYRTPGIMVSGGLEGGRQDFLYTSAESAASWRALDKRVADMSNPLRDQHWAVDKMGIGSLYTRRQQGSPISQSYSFGRPPSPVPNSTQRPESENGSWNLAQAAREAMQRREDAVAHPQASVEYRTSNASTLTAPTARPSSPVSSNSTLSQTSSPQYARQTSLISSVSPAPPSSGFAADPRRAPTRTNTMISGVSSASSNTKIYQRGTALAALEGQRGSESKRSPNWAPKRLPPLSPKSSANRLNSRESRPFLDWSEDESEGEHGMAPSHPFSMAFTPSPPNTSFSDFPSSPTQSIHSGRSASIRQSTASFSSVLDPHLQSTTSHPYTQPHRPSSVYSNSSIIAPRASGETSSQRSSSHSVHSVDVAAFPQPPVFGGIAVPVSPMSSNFDTRSTRSTWSFSRRNSKTKDGSFLSL